MIEHEDQAVVVSTDNKASSITPNKLSLNQNYPNPFNPTTSFNYNLAENGKIKMTITDIIGREIVTLIDDYQRQGNHNILWTGKDKNGDQVPSGIYFYNLKSGSTLITKKMTLTK